MVRKALLIIIILCSLEFYEFAFIPEVILKASTLIGIGIIAALIVINLVYSREKTVKMNFAFPIILIFISVIISMIGSYAFHDQSFELTAYGQKAIYYYLIYFLLHLMKLEEDFLIKMITALGLIYIPIYFLQYFIYPVEISTRKMFIDRGTLRIFLNGSGYLVISYFIWLYMVVKQFRVRYVILLLLTLGVFVVMGTRQVIAALFLLTLLYIFQSRLIKSKVLLFILVGVALVPVYFIFQDIFKSLFQLTVEQSQNIQGGNRFEAAKFFLTRFYSNDLAYFTGNGAPYSSMYKLRMLSYSDQFGYFLSDIGLIGEYVQYGAIFVVAVILIFYRVLKEKLEEKLLFIKYNFLGLLLTLVTAGGAFGSSGMNILVNCILLYMIDLNIAERGNAESQKQESGG